MARTPGARNSGFTEQRNALISKLRDRLAQKDGPNASLRELALAAGVSVATLRHYFRDRRGVVSAVLDRGRQLGEVHLTHTREPLEVDLESSVHEFLMEIVRGWGRGIGTLHAVGLAEGLKSDAAGLSYLVNVLEPTQQALERRLHAHMERGEMKEADARYAALWLLSPVLIALLHQNELGGRKYRPLDINALVAEHARVFASVYGAQRNELNVGAW